MPANKLSPRRGGVLLYIGIVALTVLSLSFTLNGQSLAALRALKPLSLLPTLALWLVCIVCDALALRLFLKASGHRLGFWPAMGNTFIRLYFNLVTPFSSGGQPFAIADLHGRGVPGGAAGSAVFAKTIAYTVFGFAASFAAFLGAGQSIGDNPGLSAVLISSGLMGLLTVAAFVLALCFPPILILGCRGLERAMFVILGRSRLWKRISGFSTRFLAHCSICRRCMTSYFRRGLVPALFACLLVALQYLANLLVLLSVLRALGSSLGIFPGLALASLLFLAMNSLPTPGGSGLGELAFMGIFAAAAPLHVRGLAVLVWRVFNQYANALIGAIVSMRRIGNGKNPPTAETLDGSTSADAA